jgi:CHAD domain-containing protein
MLRKKHLRHYFNGKWKNLAGISKKLEKGPDSDLIHDLRLQVKKIKAVTELLKSGGKHPKNFSVSEIKPMFKDAGTIRTAEMHLKQLKEAGLEHPDVRKELMAETINGYIKLIENQKKYLKDIRQTKKAFNKHIRSIKERKLKRYFLYAVGALALELQGTLHTEQLHEFRKNIKELLYVFKMLPQKLQRKINLNVPWLDQLQEAIGDWHDLDLTASFLKEKGFTSSPAFRQVNQKVLEKLKQIRTALSGFDKPQFLIGGAQA